MVDQLAAALIVFAITFVSNIMPFAGAPYTVITSNLILIAGGTLPVMAFYILVSGVAAATAKVATYALGIALKRPLKENKNIAFLKRFSETRGFTMTLFVTAILPGLPLDDYLFIGGGVVRAPLTRMLAVTLLAKLLKSAVEVPLVTFGIIHVSSLTGVGALELTVISSLLFLLLGFVLLKVDWEKLYSSIKRKYPKLNSKRISRLRVQR